MIDRDRLHGYDRAFICPVLPLTGDAAGGAAVAEICGYALGAGGVSAGSDLKRCAAGTRRVDGLKRAVGCGGHVCRCV